MMRVHALIACLAVGALLVGGAAAADDAADAAAAPAPAALPDIRVVGKPTQVKLSTWCHKIGNIAINYTCTEFALANDACDNLFRVVAYECDKRKASDKGADAAADGGAGAAGGDGAKRALRTWEEVLSLDLTVPLTNFARAKVKVEQVTHTMLMGLPMEDRYGREARDQIVHCLNLPELGTSDGEAAVDAAGDASAAGGCKDTGRSVMAETVQRRAEAHQVGLHMCDTLELEHSNPLCRQLSSHASMVALRELATVMDRRVQRDMWLTAASSIDGTAAVYADRVAAHKGVNFAFWSHAQRQPALTELQDHFVDQGQSFGNRGTLWAWRLLVAEQEDEFKVLASGSVQDNTYVVAAVAKIAELLGKRAHITAITQQDGADDAASGQKSVKASMAEAFEALDIDDRDITIVEGRSNAEASVEAAAAAGPYDVLFVDGAVDRGYVGVADDLRNFLSLLKVGGYLVVDDCASNLRTPAAMRGLVGASLAVDEVLPPHRLADSEPFRSQLEAAADGGDGTDTEAPEGEGEGDGGEDGEDKAAAAANRAVASAANLERMQRVVDLADKTGGSYDHLFAVEHERVWRKTDEEPLEVKSDFERLFGL